VVDEAQNLPHRTLEELRMLSNYQQDGKALLQSFLLGQPELKRTLQRNDMEQVRQRIIAGYHLRPLNREELQAYIEHRLEVVDWDNDPALTEAAFDVIYEATGGVPRRINNLCDRLLLFGALEELHGIEGDNVQAVVDEMADEYAKSEGGDVDDFPGGVERPAAWGGGDAETRIAALEAEVVRLRSSLNKTRRAVKQALLLQLQADDDEDEDL
jgi:hypothetical protein